MLPTVCVTGSPSNGPFLSARTSSGPPFSIVLLCAVTGVAAIVMTAIAYRRDHRLKHSHLEVADFHFHFTPSSSVGHYVSSLCHKWRHLWSAPSSRRDNIRMDSYDRLWTTARLVFSSRVYCNLSSFITVMCCRERPQLPLPDVWCGEKKVFYYYLKSRWPSQIVVSSASHRSGLIFIVRR